VIVNEVTWRTEILAEICAVTAGCRDAEVNVTVRVDVHKTLVELLPGKLRLCTALLLNEMQDEVPPLHLVLKSDAVHKLPIFVLPATWIVTIGPLHEPDKTAGPLIPLFPISIQVPADVDAAVGAEAYGPFEPTAADWRGLPLLSTLNDAEAATGLGSETVTVGAEVYPEPPDVMTVPETEPPEIVAVAVACPGRPGADGGLSFAGGLDLGDGLEGGGLFFGGDGLGSGLESSGGELGI
jgi:hypothetical protein